MNTNIVSNTEFENRRKAKNEKAPSNVTDDEWDGFSPITKADGVTNDIVATIFGSFKDMGIDVTAKDPALDVELTILYDAIDRIMKRHFGVDEKKGA